jgi:hypothetical protein
MYVLMKTSDEGKTMLKMRDDKGKARGELGEGPRLQL